MIELYAFVVTQRSSFHSQNTKQDDENMEPVLEAHHELKK